MTDEQLEKVAYAVQDAYERYSRMEDCIEVVLKYLGFRVDRNILKAMWIAIDVHEDMRE